jgi:YVTN family beta-propeller protein
MRMLLGSHWVCRAFALSVGIESGLERRTDVFRDETSPTYRHRPDLSRNKEVLMLGTFLRRSSLILTLLPLCTACGDSATGPVDDASGDLRSLSLPSLSVTYQAAVTESGVWVQNPENRHTYALTDNMPYLEAEAWAVAHGGHLVTLNSWEEELWLKQTFGENEHFFIGFNDIEEEGNWVWTSGAQVTYTNWAPGEPNDYMGEDAAAMNWCEEGGNENPECLGDTWNDLGTGGGRAIAEVRKGPDEGQIDPIPELAYVGHQAPFISVVDVQKMVEIGRIPTEGNAENPTISPDGRTLWVPTSGPPSLAKVDLTKWAVVETLPLPGGSGPADAALTPSGHTIFITEFYGHTVTAVDTRDLSVLAVIPLTDEYDYVNGIAMGPGGRHVFVASQVSGRVHVIDVDKLEAIAAIETGATVNELAVTQDGRFLFVTQSGASSVVVIDAKKFTVVTTIDVGPGPNGIAIPPNGREAYVVHAAQNLLTVIDTKTLSVVTTIAVPERARRIEVNTNGHLGIVTTQFSADATLIDLAERSILGTVSLPGGSPWGAAFLNGHRLKSGMMGAPTSTYNFKGEG